MPADRAAASADELALLRTVLADPADPVALSVYCDFLDDHADPRGAYLREFLLPGSEMPDPPPGTSAAWASVLAIPARRYLRRQYRLKAEPMLRATTAAVRFAGGDVLNADEPLGTSRIGGGPDLPDDAGEFGPDGFLMQLDLADLRGTLADGMLPEAGLLLLFCYYDSPGGAVYVPPGTPLRRRLPDDGGASPMRAVRLSDGLRYAVPEGTEWKYIEAFSSGAGVSFSLDGHWLCTPCVGPVQMPDGETLPGGDSLLLAVFDQDYDLGFAFHDGDPFYIFVPAADAREGRFDRVGMFDAT